MSITNKTTNHSFVVKNMARFRDSVQSARDKTPVMRLGVEGKTKLDKTEYLTSYLRGLKQRE